MRIPVGCLTAAGECLDPPPGNRNSGHPQAQVKPHASASPAAGPIPLLLPFFPPFCAFVPSLQLSISVLTSSGCSLSPFCDSSQTCRFGWISALFRPNSPWTPSSLRRKKKPQISLSEEREAARGTPPPVLLPASNLSPDRATEHHHVQCRWSPQSSPRDAACSQHPAQRALRPAQARV